MFPRKARISCIYNGVNITTQLAPFLGSFRYTDVASGSSDSIAVEINDKERKWIGPWFPVKGDVLEPTIIVDHWEKELTTQEFNCGTFHADDFSFSGGPVRLSLEALALPTESGFNTTERTETYECFTLQEIGQEIADRSGVALHYEGDTVFIQKVEQSNQTDCDFYNKLVQKYGLVMKVFNDKIVVFMEDVYEIAPAKLTLTEKDFDPGWQWNTKMVGTYTGIDYQYTNSEQNLTYFVNFGLDTKRVLTCNEPCSSLQEAIFIAFAAINNANKDTTTMTLKMIARPWLIATDCIRIEGMGQLDGKYYIEKIDHDMGAGYATELTMRRLEGRYIDLARYNKLFPYNAWSEIADPEKEL